MKKIRISITLLIILLFNFCTAFAHDPGTSFAKIDVSGNRMNLKIAFTLKDIETLVDVNTNHDDQYSKIELEKARPELIELISNGVEARIGNRIRSADRYDISIDNNENLVFNVEFSDLKISKISLSMPILKQLPHGHRLFALVNNDTNSNQRVLDAGSKPIYLDGYENYSDANFNQFYSQGMHHIFFGFDHVLFLLTLLLPAVLIFNKNMNYTSANLATILFDTFKIVTAFTITHSITLALAVLDFVQLPGRLVESVIALSIIICAINNLRPVLPVSRWTLAFGFGLIHGFGFANALTELGIESKKSIVPLLGFNLGIETGQLLIIIVILPIIYMIRHSSIFKIWIFKGGSVASILVAVGWMIERSYY